MHNTAIHPVIGMVLAACVFSVSSSDTHASEKVGSFEKGAALLVFGGKGSDRAYALSKDAGFASQDFAVECTVTIPNGGGGDGSAFIGLGNGRPVPSNYNEPTSAPAVVFRLCPSDFAGGQCAAIVGGDDSETGTVGSGTHRLRFLWKAEAHRAMLSIHKNWKPDDAFTPTVFVEASAKGVIFPVGSDHLFAGGAGGVSFSDISIHRGAEVRVSLPPLSDSFKNDPTQGTWLAPAGGHVTDKDELGNFLAQLHGRMRPVVCWYHGAHIAATRTVSGGKLDMPHSKWTTAFDVKPVAGDRSAIDLTASFTLEEGVARNAGIALAFDFADWRIDNFVMVPCIVYDGNRNRIIGGGYAEGLPKADWYRKDLPLTIRQTPHLALDPKEPSRFDVLVNNTGTPCVGFLSRKTGKAFLLLAEQAGRTVQGDFLRKGSGQAGDEIRDSGFCVEESADRSRATIVVSAPGVRKEFPMFVGFSASPDRAMAWKQGDQVSLRLRLFSFDAKDMAGFYDKFMSARKSVTGPNHPRNLRPMSEVERLMTALTDGCYISGKDSRTGKECHFYRSINFPAVNFGWVGGLMNTFPMLALGDDMHVERVTQTFDFAIPRGQGASGYFYGELSADGPYGREGYPDPKIALSRRSADVLYWMLKQFLLLKAQGRPVKPAWEANIRRLADAFVKTWKANGQWGNYLHVDTGEVVIYNSTSAARAAGGLALASVWYGNPEYLAVAREAAAYYYKRDFLGGGATTGHCADTLQNADSESPIGLADSLVALHEISGEAKWLDMARNVLNLQASWVTSFDYELPKSTTLGKLDAKLAGVVCASTQNKHGAPGLCTSAGESLFKVYRITGDARYADLLNDIWHAHGEGIQSNGEISERLSYCDAGDRGALFGFTPWNATNGAMMAIELPGIYLRTDADRFFVFDSVKAQVKRRDATGVVLEITNDTSCDAVVKIFAEAGGQAQKPLGFTAFLNWPKVKVPKGETRKVKIAPDGTPFVTDH